MKCELCPADATAYWEKLDPRNLRARRRALCRKCARTAGYRPLDFGRTGIGQLPGAPPRYVDRHRDRH